MKKISKSKKGFTLVEMVLVIAIICILAAVIFSAVSDYLNRADNATSAMESYYTDINTVTAAIPS
ncbi:MAG: type II secretion system GspH family protein [Clostridia bacterium]|nr:type II secretion system GspH family protein [Clostridia bacterium]